MIRKGFFIALQLLLCFGALIVCREHLQAYVFEDAHNLGAVIFYAVIALLAWYGALRVRVI